MEGTVWAKRWDGRAQDAHHRVRSPRQSSGCFGRFLRASFARGKKNKNENRSAVITDSGWGTPTRRVLHSAAQASEL